METLILMKEYWLSENDINNLSLELLLLAREKISVENEEKMKEIEKMNKKNK